MFRVGAKNINCLIIVPLCTILYILLFKYLSLLLMILRGERVMAKNKEVLKITCATTEDFNLIYDGMENYFIFYNGEQVGETITDKTSPKELLKIVDSLYYTDLKEPQENPTINGLINAISLKDDKLAFKMRLLRQTLNDLVNVNEDDNLHMQHFKKAKVEVRDFINNLNIEYGYDNPFVNDDDNLGNSKEFNLLFESKYEHNWFEMLDNELYDYVDNTNNIFMAIIMSLAALFGYGSRIIIVNGGSEVGKSEFMNAIKKLMPFYINLGKATPASVRRQEEEAFDRKIVYIGDRGLAGKSQTSKEEFEGLFEVFGGLATEGEFTRPLVVGDEVVDFYLKSSGVCVFLTEPYTNLRSYGAGDQHITRSGFITVNPVKDGLSVFLQDEDQVNGFYDIHKNYVLYILNNPLDLKISDEVKIIIWQSSRESLRTAKYLLGLFKAYCQYMRIGNPLESDVIQFLDTFKPKYNITDIEFLVYEKLYNSLTPLTSEDLEYKIYEEDGSCQSQDMLLQTKDRKKKSFFTYKQIQTYFRTDFKHNKNLKDTLDQIGTILNNLYNAELLNRLEYQYHNTDVYYIPYNKDMEK